MKYADCANLGIYILAQSTYLNYGGEAAPEVIKSVQVGYTIPYFTTSYTISNRLSSHHGNVTHLSTPPTSCAPGPRL